MDDAINLTNQGTKNNILKRGDRPTLDQVRTIIKSEVDRNSSIHARMESWEAWEKDGAPVTVCPKGYQPFKQPLAYIIRGAAGMLITDNPEIKVDSGKKGQAGEDQKEILKLFCENELKWANRQTRCDIVKELARVGLRSGIAVLQGPVYDKDAWGEEPGNDASKEEKQKYDANKYATHPYKYFVFPSKYFNPMEDGIGCVIEYYRKASDIKQSFPDWNDEGKDRDQDVKWQEYWDGYYRCFLVDNEPVLVNDRREAPNEGGDGIQPTTLVPYQWAFSTFGNNEKGKTMEERCVGLFSGLDTVFSQHNNLLTAFFADIGHRVYHTFKAVKGKWERLSKGPGSVVEVKEDVNKDFTILNQGSTATDFPSAVAMLNNMIELNTFTKEVLGMGASPTATQTGMRLSQAKLPFSPFIHQIEELVAEALQKAAYDFKINPELTTMPLGNGKRIKQDDITIPLVVTIDLQPVDPELNDRLLQAGEELWGKLDGTTVIKDFWKKDPETVWVNKLFESIIVDPETQAFCKKQGMLMAAAELQLNEAQELLKQTEQGIGVEVSDTMVQTGQQMNGFTQPAMPGLPPDRYAMAGRAQGRIGPAQPRGPFGSTAEQAGNQKMTQGQAQ